MNIYKQKDKKVIFSVFGVTRCNVNYIKFVVQHSFTEIHHVPFVSMKKQWSQINYVNGCTRNRMRFINFQNKKKSFNVIQQVNCNCNISIHASINTLKMYLLSEASSIGISHCNINITLFLLNIKSLNKTRNKIKMYVN